MSKIQKDKDIEELVEQEDRKLNDENTTKDMQDIIKDIDRKAREFNNRVRIEKEAMKKKVDNYSKRKDSQNVEEEKKNELRKVMNKIEEKQKEESEER